MREAAVFWADSLSDGWQQAVADRAADYAQTAWERLSRSRRKRNCKALAHIARSILAQRRRSTRLSAACLAGLPALLAPATLPKPSTRS